MNRIEKLVLGVSLAAMATPAFAGDLVRVPAPAVGIGVGAVILMGIGYRAIKSRISR